MAIDVEKPSVDESVVKYQARTILLQLAYEIAQAGKLSRVQNKINKAYKIVCWLKALDFDEWLTYDQKYMIVYKLLEISGVNNFPTSPVLDLRTRPNILIGGGGSGSGSVTSFSSGDLSPLFTTTVVNPTTTPSLSFSLTDADQNTVFSGPVSSSGAPSFRLLDLTDLPSGVALLTDIDWNNLLDIPDNILYGGQSNTFFLADTDFAGNGFKLNLGTNSGRFSQVNANASSGITLNTSGGNVAISASAGNANLFADGVGNSAGLFGPSSAHFVSVNSSGFLIDGKGPLSISGSVSIGSSTNTVSFVTTGNTSVTLPTTGTLGLFNQIGGKSVSSLVTAPGAGQNTYSITWDNAGNQYTLSPSSSVTPAALTTADDTNVTLTLGGTPTTALLQATSLTLGWNGRLAYSRFTQGSALSVLGVTGNSTADQASIAGTADQVLRVNSAGTTLAFGSIDLSKSGTVGSSILPIANGGTGASSFPGWLLASGGALTGNNTISGAFNLAFSNAQFSRTSTYTTTANNDFGLRYTGTITARATASDTFRFINLDPTMVSGAATQNAVAFRIAPTFTATGGAFSSSYIVELVGSVGSVVVNSTGALSTTRGLDLSGLGGSAGANVINFGTSTNSLISATGNNNVLILSGGTSTQAGAANRFIVNHTFAPTAGTTTTNLVIFQHTINQVGATGPTANVLISTVPTAMVGNHTMLSFVSSSGISLANTLIGIDYNPTITSVTTNVAFRATSGALLMGTTLTSGSVLADFQSTSRGVLMPRVTNIASVTTPVAGMIAYDAATNKFNFRENASWIQIGGIGGTTGSADNAVLRADGTGGATMQASSVIVDDSGNCTWSPSVNTSNITFTAASSVTSTGFTFTTKGTSGFFDILTDFGFDIYNTAPSTSSRAGVFFSTSTPGQVTMKGFDGVAALVGGGHIYIKGGDGYSSGNNAGGDVHVGGGTPNGSGALGRIIFDSVANLKSYTVATLPTGNVGDIAYVTDALAPAYLTTIAGGGSIKTPVFYNGTNWVAF